MKIQARFKIQYPMKNLDKGILLLYYQQYPKKGIY